MIHYLNHAKIDKVLWDRTITDAPNGTLCAYSWFLDIVSPGWDGLVGEGYKDVFPITKANKYFTNYLRQPLFTQQLGLISTSTTGLLDCSQYISKCIEHFKFMEINLRYDNAVQGIDVELSKNINLRLDLSNSHDAIFKAYSENHKRNIKKSRGNDLVLNREGHINDIIKLFDENKRSSLSDFNESHYNLLKQIVNVAQRKIKVSIYTVADEHGLPCAGAVFLVEPRAALFLFSGANQKGRDLRAMHYLIDNFINDHCQHIGILDFEGSNDENLARFYRGFGSVESVYLHISYNNLPIPFRWFK